MINPIEYCFFSASLAKAKAPSVACIIFDPDMLIVDKEPLGLRGEVRPTLDLLQARGTPLILGLRDVMDDPSALETEWERKNAIPALNEFYNEIWVYGLPQICDPLEGLDLPASVRRRMVYTGYLRRTVPSTFNFTSAEVSFLSSTRTTRARG